MLNETKIPLPNPEDWTDAAGAAAILGRSRATVHDMASRGVLAPYPIGGRAMFWVPECRDLAAALTRVGGRRG